ncbi:MAG: EscU/YscU/HrcU family type III secretion system export apparatus switch protein [Desulfobacteraceae bacterium]|nr:EscU/YscU/HrcU family type III secretion system export apparatus switch protein [Desulfobacteraceae bacterium]
MKKQKEIKKAVAIKYDSKEDIAPRIKAKGAGAVAENIIELAKKHGVPIKDDPDLVEILSQLNIDEAIPPDVYVAVAELLSFVYSLNSKKA